MTPLNIVQIFYARPHLGGSGIISMETSKELARRGHNVYIVSYPGTYLNEEEEKIGLEIRPVKKINYPCFKAEPYNATFASKIVNIYLNEGVNIDIIHANYAITHGEAALTAKRIIQREKGNPKVVVTSHGSDIHTNGYQSLLAPSIKDTLQSADAITFVSKALQKEAKQLFGLKHSGTVIYNFVNEKKFGPASLEEKIMTREKLNIPRDAFVVYHASNFRPIKQTEMILEAARELDRQERKNIFFLFVGDGPQKRELEEKATLIYNLNNKIIFTGIKYNVLPYIHAADIGVFPSKRESFGLALLECMSCGLPVLGSNVGGIPEVIDHNKTGYLFKHNSLDELVFYIKKLTDNPDLRKKMGAAAREKAITKFPRKTIIDAYETLYLSLVGK